MFARIESERLEIAKPSVLRDAAGGVHVAGAIPGWRRVCTGGRFVATGALAAGDRAWQGNADVDLRPSVHAQAQVARSVGVSESTVSRVLARAGLSKLSDLRPLEPLQRGEHEAPGDLLHIDTKRLGRIVRPSHRVTGNRRDGVDGAGWETLFVAIDDHARIAFMATHPDEKTPQAVQFLKDAVAYCARLGVSIKRPLTETVRCSARTTSHEPARGPGHQAPFHACLPAADQR